MLLQAFLITLATTLDEVLVALKASTAHAGPIPYFRGDSTFLPL